jgi:hypothetical protein
MLARRARRSACIVLCLALVAVMCGCQAPVAPASHARAEPPPPPPPPAPLPSPPAPPRAVPPPEAPIASRGADAAAKLLVARAFLYADMADTGSGFGAYSYLLLTREAPIDLTLQRYQQAMAGYVSQPADCGAIAETMPPGGINVLFVPLRLQRQSVVITAECGEDAELPVRILANYDHERAALLASKAGLVGEGPYLVSGLDPLDANLPARARLVWNLSGVPPELVRLWVSEFIARASRPGSWDQASFRHWALELRTWITENAPVVTITREAAAATLKVSE